MDKGRDGGRDEVYRAFEELLEEGARRLRWKEEHRYVPDLIATLAPHPNGLSRQRVLTELEKKRRADGHPEVERFEEAVQSSFNRYNGGSRLFKGPPENDLFWSRKEGRYAMWGVHAERAHRWLKSRLEKLK